MTDISSIVAAPRVVDIKHPATGEPIGLKVTLLPVSDSKVQSAQRRLINDRLQRHDKPTAEKMEQNKLALLEAAVSDWTWEGDLTFEGGKPEFTPSDLRKVLKKLPWVRDQIDIELGNEAAFFEASATS